MKIIITGSLGHIGKPLSKELAEKNHDVTVISSKEERRKDIENLGATAAIGSLEDLDFLVQTFTGADAVFAMVPPKYDETDTVVYYRRLADTYAEAIKNAGVKHVVHLSSYGAHLNKDTGFILGAHNAEGILDGLQSVAITHLRPGYFYYNLMNFAPMIKGQNIIGSNYGGDDKLVLVSPKDIAAAAVEELVSQANGTKIRYVVSDERTCNETALVLGEAIGKPDLKWLTFTNEQTKDAMMKGGVSAHVADNFVQLGAAIHNGILVEDYEKHKPSELGKIKLEEYAREFAAAL